MAADLTKWPIEPGDLLADVADVAQTDVHSLSVYAAVSAEGRRAVRFRLEPVSPSEAVEEPSFVVEDEARLHELIRGLLDAWTWLRGQGS